MARQGIRLGRFGTAGTGGLWDARGRSGGGSKTSKGLDAAPSGVGVVARFSRNIGNERDTTGRIELDDGRDTGDVGRFGVLDRRRRESPCAVVFNIDDVGSREVIGNEGEFLLRAGLLEERGGLPMGSGERLIARVVLRVGLEVGD